MSTYVLAEDALLDAVRASSDGGYYDDANSSRGDFNVLNNAAVNRAAVLIQGGDSDYADNLGQGRGTHGRRQQRHVISIVLFRARREDNDGIAYRDMADDRDGLIGYLDTVQRLGSSDARIKRAQVTLSTEPRVRRDSAWIYSIIVVQVLTETSPVLVQGAH